MQWSEEIALQKLKRTLAAVWGVNDKHDWPVRLNTVSHLFAGEFYEDLYKAFHMLVQKGYDLKSIGSLFGSPSRILRSFDLILKGMYLKKVPVPDKRQFICELLNCAQTMKVGSVFNEDGVNRILNESSLNGLVEWCNWKGSDLEASRELHGLIGLLKAHIEILYYRIYDISQEIHGPYAVADMSSLLVREFKELKPENLYPDTEFTSFSSLTIFTEYDQGVKIKIDPYNHMVQEGESFIPNLKRWAVAVDGGDVADIGELRALKEELFQVIRQNSSMTDREDWREAARKYARICWYKADRLFEAAFMKKDGLCKALENIETGLPQKLDERFFDSGKINLLLNILV